MPESGVCASGNVAAETWLTSGMGLEWSLCSFLCFNWAGRWASLVARLVKNPPAVQETPVPGSGRSPGEGIGYQLQYSRLENPHGQKSLAGCSPWGHTELNRSQHSAARQGRQVNRAWSTTLWSKCLMTCCVARKYLPYKPQT